MKLSRKELEKIIDLKIRIERLERTDTEREEILDAGSYALAEGYKTRNMEEVEDLEERLDKVFTNLDGNI